MIKQVHITFEIIRKGQVPELISMKDVNLPFLLRRPAASRMRCETLMTLLEES
jgi:hypothetical protein